MQPRLLKQEKQTDYQTGAIANCISQPILVLYPSRWHLKAKFLLFIVWMYCDSYRSFCFALTGNGTQVQLNTIIW